MYGKTQIVESWVMASHHFFDHLSMEAVRQQMESYRISAELERCFEKI